MAAYVPDGSITRYCTKNAVPADQVLDEGLANCGATGQDVASDLKRRPVHHRIAGATTASRRRP